MITFLSRVSLFVQLLFWTEWISAVPLDSVVYHTPEHVVWETVVITKTTVVCPTILGSSTSSTRYYTRTISRASTSPSYGTPPSRLVSTSSSAAVSSTTSGVYGSSSREDVSFGLPIHPSGSPGSFWTLSSQPSNISYTFSNPKVSSSATITSTDSSLYSSIATSTEPLYRRPSTAAYGTPTLTTTASSTISYRLPPSPIITSMGQSRSTLRTSSSHRGSRWRETWRESSLREAWRESSLRETWRESSLRETWRDTWKPHGMTTKTVSSAILEDNIFVPIEKDKILPQIPISRHHPVERKGIEDDDTRTLHTNKFYANVFLGQQNQPVWTQPYSIWWGKGDSNNGQFPTWGMNIAHIEADDIVYGEGDPAQNYVNPTRRQSLILAAQELSQQTTLSTDNHLPFSVHINLNHESAADEPTITFPVVQGMSFVTGGYRNATPVIQCPGKGFRYISHSLGVGKSTKYRMQDNDGRNWLVYVNPVSTVPYDPTAFRQIDPNTLLGPSGFRGTIQIAKNPLGAEGEALYDKATGAFACEASITGTVNETRGAYSLNYTKVGSSPLLMFALPHHLQSLDPDLKSKITKLELRTTTKGMATAIWADRLTFIEPNLPISMGFGPWTPTLGFSKTRYPPAVLEVISAVAERDLVLVSDETPADSLYYAGKTLAKFATILWVLRDILNNTSTFPAGLDKLKARLAVYIQNKQHYPLFYDDTWKGVVSNAGFNDPGADFGNTYYNDHHFHFGYFVYAAAVVGYLDAEWLGQGDNKAWVQTLVKDFAESDYHGRDYPFSRSFDWWNGHSWAKGLFESADGKDEESTSEDGFASFAVKMWGKVIGDLDMEKRGNLMLAIQARSFNNYFYMQDNNTNQPPRFLGNKVSGIFFENKVDYATYFGTAPELIHGIHMLPLSPASTLLRPKAFVLEEWNRFFRDGGKALVPGGWRGILFANLAIVDPRTAYNFFRDGVDGEWDDGWIDGGASRTWYLVWCAGLGGGR